MPVPDTTRFTTSELLRRPAEPDDPLPDVICVDLADVPPPRRAAVANAIRDLVARYAGDAGSIPARIPALS